MALLPEQIRNAHGILEDCLRPIIDKGYVYYFATQKACVHVMIVHSSTTFACPGDIYEAEEQEVGRLIESCGALSFLSFCETILVFSQKRTGVTKLHERSQNMPFEQKDILNFLSIHTDLPFFTVKQGARMAESEYIYRWPGWLKDVTDMAALTEIIVEGMFEDSISVLMLKIENFCEDRSLSVSYIKQSIMASIAYGIYKRVEDVVITKVEEEYFFAFLNCCGVEFSEIPVFLQRLFMKGIDAEKNIPGNN